MKQVEPSDPHSKGPDVSDVTPRAHSRAPATPSTRRHISTRTARFIYYVQPLTPLPSWRQVFQFLISLLPLRWHSKCSLDWHLKLVTHRAREPTALMSFCFNASFLLRSSNSGKPFYLSSSGGLVVIKSFYFKPSTSFRMKLFESNNITRFSNFFL